MPGEKWFRMCILCFHTVKNSDLHCNRAGTARRSGQHPALEDEWDLWLLACEKFLSEKPERLVLDGHFNKWPRSIRE